MSNLQQDLINLNKNISDLTTALANRPLDDQQRAFAMDFLSKMEGLKEYLNDEIARIAEEEKLRAIISKDDLNKVLVAAKNLRAKSVRLYFPVETIQAIANILDVSEHIYYDDDDDGCANLRLVL